MGTGVRSIDQIYAQAAIRRHDPWIFEREGWDWRWISFAEGVARIASVAAGMATLPEETPIRLESELTLEGVLIDLAWRTSGRIAQPRAATMARFTVDPSDGVEQVRLSGSAGPAVEEPTPRVVESVRNSESGAVPAAEGGGVIVEVEAGRQFRSEEDLERAVVELTGRIGRAAEREIVVVGGRLNDPGIRLVLSWACSVGAALVVAPSAEAMAATTIWARPTLIHGTRQQLHEVAGLVNKELGGSRRSRIRRLRRTHAVLFLGREGPTPVEVAEWRGLGIDVCHVPDPLALEGSGQGVRNRL